MKVLVTGAAGFIGSAVCEALHRRGHEVVGIDSLNETLYPAASRRARIMDMAERGIADIHIEDLRTCDLDDLLLGVDGVVHEAAIPGLGPSWTAIEEYVTNNVVGTYRLADAVTRSHVSAAVLASTSSVYGTTATDSEAGALRPASPYGITKLAAEQTWKAVVEPDRVVTTILRYFSVYGPHQRQDMAIGRFMRNVREGLPVTITGDGLQTRTYSYIDDVSNITASALELQREGIFNIAGTEQVSVLELVSLIGRVVGAQPILEFLPPRRGDQLEVKGDVEAAQDVLRFAPQVTLVEGLTRQFEALIQEDGPSRPALRNS